MRTATQDIYGNPTEMTFGVQLLLGINLSAFAIEHIFRFPLSNFCALQSNWFDTFSIWQLITYQFIHQGIFHLISNLLGLYLLGPDTERGLGTNRFLLMYFLSGILGGLGWSLLSPSGIFCVGASGCVFGILGAYAALYPHQKLVLLLFPLKPIKAWIFVLLLGLYELHQTVSLGSGSSIANAAHFSGGIAGYIYALVIGRPDIIRQLKIQFRRKPKSTISRTEIDRILDKATRHGIHTLTQSEREALKRASQSGHNQR